MLRALAVTGVLLASAAQANGQFCGSRVVSSSCFPVRRFVETVVVERPTIIIRERIKPVAILNGQFVSVDFAVPVGIPVAPFAPYWYESSQRSYQANGHQSPSVHPGAANGAATASEQAVDGRNLIRAKCAGCHGGTNPKGKLVLSDPEAIAGWAAERKTEILFRVLSNDPAKRMPKNKPALNDAEVRGLSDFLMGAAGEQARDEPPPRPEATPADKGPAAPADRPGGSY